MVTKDDHRDARSGAPLRTAAIAQQLQDDVGDLDVVSRWKVPTIRTHDDRQIVPPPPVAVMVAYLRVLFTSLPYFCPEVRHRISFDMVRKIVALNRDRDYAVTIIEFSTLLVYRKILRGAVILDMHNVESALMANYERTLSRPRSITEMRHRIWVRWNVWGLTRLESRIGRFTNHMALVSETDEVLISKLMGKRGNVQCVVAPNGVTDRAFEYETPRSETVVFVGYLGWAPNSDASTWLVNEVWPEVVRRRPSAKLQLVGREPGERVFALANESVSVHPDVPDVMPYVGGATVATAPLLAAGGTRLKILEALGAGTPVVSTSMGALGLEHLEGAQLRIADDPLAFADEIVEILTAGVTRERESAVRVLAEPYRWRNALRPLTELVEALSGTVDVPANEAR